MPLFFSRLSPSIARMSLLMVLLISSWMPPMKSSPWMTTLLLKALVSQKILYIDSKSSSIGESKPSIGESESSIGKSSLLKSPLLKSFLLKLIRISSSCLIINSSFFRVLQQFIGVDYLGELLLGSWIFLVPIRVILPRPLLKCSFYLIFVGISINSQDFVGVWNLFGLNGDLCEDKEEEK